MLTDAEIQRIEETQKALRRSNCIGTILYVCGVVDKDEYVGNREKKWSEGIVESYLDTLVKSDKPQLGSVVVIRKKYWRIGQKNLIEHMGLIVEENPLMVFERAGKKHLTPVITSLPEFLHIFEDNYTLIEYYNKK